ncbi:MAG: hypothetical protein JNJ75_04150 [Cyclobacteriaceae bacterium]|nr:hypothetical protein [Cyclobacteriaceae bacterium]
MKVRLFFVLAFLLVIQISFAQTYAFKVLVSKGKTEVKNDNNWQSIKVGASLKPTDEVKIGENAYLGLIHATGKPLEVREAKTYKVSELVSKIAPGTSVINKYTDFILSSETEKKNRLSATGAVHRDITKKDNIHLFLPKSEQAKVYGNHVLVQWTPAKIEGNYKVAFTDMMGAELTVVQTTDTRVLLDLSDEKFKKENQVLVHVSGKGKRTVDSGDDLIIQRVKPSERHRIDSLYAAANLPPDDSALTKYVLASFYEENMLLLDAQTAYYEAAKLAPDVELYSSAYEEFLKRMGFVK